MNQGEIEVTKVDLEDHAAIRQYVPEATPKEVKWIEDTLEDLRSLGTPEPVGQKVLQKMSDAIWVNWQKLWLCPEHRDLYEDFDDLLN